MFALLALLSHVRDGGKTVTWVKLSRPIRADAYVTSRDSPSRGGSGSSVEPLLAVVTKHLRDSILFSTAVAQ